MRRVPYLFLLPVFSLGLAACTGGSECGEGTHDEDGVCVADEESDADTDADSDSDTDSDSDAYSRTLAACEAFGEAWNQCMIDMYGEEIALGFSYSEDTCQDADLTAEDEERYLCQLEVLEGMDCTEGVLPDFSDC